MKEVEVSQEIIDKMNNDEKVREYVKYLTSYSSQSDLIKVRYTKDYWRGVDLFMYFKKEYVLYHPELVKMRENALRKGYTRETVRKIADFSNKLVLPILLKSKYLDEIFNSENEKQVTIR